LRPRLWGLRPRQEQDFEVLRDHYYSVCWDQDFEGWDQDKNKTLRCWDQDFEVLKDHDYSLFWDQDIEWLRPKQDKNFKVLRPRQDQGIARLSQDWNQCLFRPGERPVYQDFGGLKQGQDQSWARPSKDQHQTSITEIH